MAARVAPLIGFLGLALCTYVWLARVNSPFPIHGDGIRDQLLVRDCTELGQCHSIGAPTSIRGARIFQGAVWLDLLTAVRVAGGDVGTQVVVVLVLNALAAALTFIVVWRWLHPVLALPAGYLVARAVAGDQASLLVNGSAPPLFDAVTAAGVLCYGLSNRIRFLLVSAFAAALAVNVHVAAVTLVPPLLLVAALGPRPFRALLWASALFAAVYFVTSGTALWANCLALADRKSLVPLLALAAASIVLVTRFGPAFRALAVPMRAVLIGCLLVVPFRLASLWLVLVEAHPLERWYFHPIAAPMAVFEAALVCGPFLLFAKPDGWWRWLPSVASLYLIVQQMSAPPAPADAIALHTWTLRDATTIGLAAAKTGWSFENLAFHLQAEGCGELLAGIAVEGPRLGDPPPDDDLQVQVATMESDASPVGTGHLVVPLEHGRVGVLRTIRSWIQPRGIVGCRHSIDVRGAPTCARLPVDVAGRWKPFEPDGVTAPERIGVPGERSLESRSALTHEQIQLPPPYVTSYWIPVRPVAGQARELRLADPGVEGCRWEFTKADGLHVRNALPATRVRVDGDGGSPGVLLIEKPFGAEACPDERELSYPPCIFETQPGEAFESILGGDE